MIAKNINNEYFILHKYFLNANLMMTNYQDAIQKKLHKDPTEKYIVTQYQNLWYAFLYVLIEGYRVEFKLSDIEIDCVLSGKENIISALKDLRNTIYHVQRDYHEKREIAFYSLDARSTVEQIREIHDCFSKRLLVLMKEQQE